MDKVTFTECERIGFGMLRKTGKTMNLAVTGGMKGAAEYLLFLLRDDECSDESGCYSEQTFTVYPWGKENSEFCWTPA
jgi:hypothetical protein